MPADGSLQARVEFTREQLEATADVGLYTAYKPPSSEKIEYEYTSLPYLLGLGPLEFPIKHQTSGCRLVELGCYCEAQIGSSEPVDLCYISTITIMSRDNFESETPPWHIYNVQVAERRSGENCQKRLTWTWQGSDHDQATSIHGLPWSKTTGPFSFFEVRFGDRELGRAYCMEFPLLEEDLTSNGGNGGEDETIEVVVCGQLFGGGSVCSEPSTLTRKSMGL